MKELTDQEKLERKLKNEKEIILLKAQLQLIKDKGIDLISKIIYFDVVMVCIDIDDVEDTWDNNIGFEYADKNKVIRYQSFSFFNFLKLWDIGLIRLG